MTLSLYCLVGYVVWAMLLVVAIVALRGVEVLAGRKRVNEFPGGVQHGGDAYWRLYRAHANTVENLSLVAILVLTAAVAHVAGPTFDRLAAVALGARVAQSLVHISSGSSLAVSVRGTFFFAQLGCFAWMAVELLRRLA